MKRWLLLTVIAGLVLGLGGGALRADEGADRIVVRFEGPLPLEDFLKAASSALDMPLVWDPKSRAFQGKEMMGSIALRGTAAELLDGLRSLLARSSHRLDYGQVGEGIAGRLARVLFAPLFWLWRRVVLALVRW